MNAIICTRCGADNHPSREDCRYCDYALPSDDWNDEDEEEWAEYDAIAGSCDDTLADDAELMRLDSARDRGFRALEEERIADEADTWDEEEL